MTQVEIRKLSKKDRAWSILVDGAKVDERPTKESALFAGIELADASRPSRICSYETDGDLDGCAELTAMVEPPPVEEPPVEEPPPEDEPLPPTPDPDTDLAVATVRVLPDVLTLTEGDQHQFAALAYNADGVHITDLASVEFLWDPRDTKNDPLGAVTQHGLFTAKAAGTVNVLASARGTAKWGRCVVTILPRVVEEEPPTPPPVPPVPPPPTTGSITPVELDPLIGPLIPLGSEPPEFPQALLAGEAKRIATNTSLIQAGQLYIQTSAASNNSTHYMCGLAMQRHLRATGGQTIDQSDPDVAAELSILAKSATQWTDLLDPYKMTHARGLALLWWLWHNRPIGTPERTAADAVRTLIHNCATWYSLWTWSEPARLDNPDAQWAGGRNIGQMLQVLRVAEWMGIPYTAGKRGGGLGSTLMSDGSKPQSWKDQRRRLYPLIRALLDNVVVRFGGMHDTIIRPDGQRAQGPPVTFGDLRAHTTAPDGVDATRHGEPYCVLFFQSAIVAFELCEDERLDGSTEAGNLAEAMVRAAIPHRRADWRSLPYRSRPVPDAANPGGYNPSHDTEGFWVAPALHVAERASDGGIFRQFALDCLDGLTVGNTAGFQAKQGHERNVVNHRQTVPARLGGVRSS